MEHKAESAAKMIIVNSSSVVDFARYGFAALLSYKLNENRNPCTKQKIFIDFFVEGILKREDEMWNPDNKSLLVTTKQPQ